ncbi:MAG: hypothetical protein HQL72_10860 [Magnetococcales bacterium]|nr:hypothetical protein [Magnetococcales bacterium]
MAHTQDLLAMEPALPGGVAGKRKPALAWGFTLNASALVLLLEESLRNPLFLLEDPV